MDYSITKMDLQSPVSGAIALQHRAEAGTEYRWSLLQSPVGGAITYNDEQPVATLATTPHLQSPHTVALPLQRSIPNAGPANL
jgi:hypothetical protein